MNAPDTLFAAGILPDVQSHADTRQLAIQRVGVKSLVHPVMVQTAKGVCPKLSCDSRSDAKDARAPGIRSRLYQGGPSLFRQQSRTGLGR
ncbi:MAG: Type cyclohydrolase folE2 [Pseudomonadota bacterium]